MNPSRRAANPSAKKGRSGNRAVIALAVMGGFVVLYLWNSFFLAPKASAKSKVAQELAAARAQEQQLRANLADLRKLANDTKAREAELARLGRLIPADPDVAGAILTLNETAQAAQVAWSSFVPSPPSAGGGGSGTSIGITMKISGSFGQIFDYLRRLELLDRLVVVDTLDLNAQGGGSGPPVIDANIKARMFSTGSAAALPKAGT